MPGVRTRWLLGIGAVLACVGLIPVALHLALVRLIPVDHLIEQWSADLGVPVRVDSASARLFPLPSMELVGVEIEPGIEIARAEVVLRLRTLLRGRFEVTRLRAYGPVLTLVRRSDGTLALGGAGDPPEAAGDGPGSTALPPLRRVAAWDGTIRYVDHTVASGPRLTELYLHRADLRFDSATQATDVRVSGSLEAGEERDAIHVAVRIDAPSSDPARRLRLRVTADRIDPARLVPHLPPAWGVRSASGSLFGRVALTWDPDEGMEGDLDLRITPGTLDYAGVLASDDVELQAGLRDDGTFRIEDGKLRADVAVLGPIEARSLESSFYYAERIVTFEPIAFEAWGGSLRAEGLLNVEDPPGFALDVTAKDLTPRRLHDRIPARALGDVTRLDAQATVRGHWRGGESWLDPIAGSGRLTMSGGDVPSGNVIRTFVELFPGRDRTWKDVADRPSWDTTPLDELSASFDLEDGRAQTRDLRVATDDYVITAEGWLDPQTDYAFDGHLVFTPTGFTKLLEVAHVEHKKDAGLPSVPFEADGNLVDDRFALELDKQPLTAVVVIPWALDQAVKTTTDAVSAGSGAATSAAEWAGELADGEE